MLGCRGILNLSERGAISPERDEIVCERGAELSGAVWFDFERWSEHPRERGVEILTAQCEPGLTASRAGMIGLYHSLRVHT